MALKSATAVFDISGASTSEAILNISGVAGSHIYLGGNALKFNQTTAATFAGVLSDGGVAGGSGGSLIVKGTATLTLGATNTFAGGIEMRGGEIELAASGAAGTGTIRFTAPAEVKIDAPALTGSGGVFDFSNHFTGAAPGDLIDLPSLAYVSGGSSSTFSGGVLTVIEGASRVTLHLDSVASGSGFSLANDGAGGTLVQVVSVASAPSVSEWHTGGLF